MSLLKLEKAKASLQTHILDEIDLTSRSWSVRALVNLVLKVRDVNIDLNASLGSSRHQTLFARRHEVGLRSEEDQEGQAMARRGAVVGADRAWAITPHRV